ncbi:THO complex subunit 2, partial [Serendipita sp. 399]
MADAAAVCDAAKRYINTWDDGGRTKCLEELIALSTQPGNEDRFRVMMQSLVNALVSPDGIRLLPDDFGAFYRDLVLAQPSTSDQSQDSPLHQILIDVISVLDDSLDDMAQAREAEKEQKSRHRSIPERQHLVKLLRYLITTNIISQRLCMVNLDYALLQDLGLIRDSAFAARQEVRARTRLIYKQTKVNLLREQSEGYSKYTVELCNSLGPPQEPNTSLDLEGLSESARRTLERLMQVAGYFDLDPTRMLDLMLDVFSTHLITHYYYFLQILSQFTESRVRLLDERKKADIPMEMSGKDITFETRLKDAEGVLPIMPVVDGLKNPLAQLLGFKLSFYATNGQNAPQTLMFVIALLIREGLFSINDIYLHLSPDEEGMSLLHTKHETEMRKRIRIAKTTAADKDNALANAPVLSADDREYNARRPPPAPVAPTVKPIKEPKMPEEVNQHRDLVVALLSIGALRPALFVLTKHPWLVSRYPQIADIMLRHLDYSINPIYRSLPPIVADVAANDAIYGPSLQDPHAVKQVKLRPTLVFPVPPPTSDVQYTFFYGQWMERIPTCSTTEDIESFLEPFLKVVGIHAYRFPQLFIKLCRIARFQLQNEMGESKPEFWTAMLRVHFLPLLSMSKDNALLGNEIWPLLQRMSANERWSIYAEWLQKTYEGTFEMKLKKALVTREAKGVLRRLSSKNQGQSARALAKIAHQNPCVVFSIAISQVMSYDNLADPLIEALRTLSPIGYDVLTFCLLDAFSQTDRPRMKDDGTNVAHWLQSLASFTAHLCRRYSQLDPAPILQFVVHRLHIGESPLDAIILRELVSKMSGIEPPQLLADAQVAAMGGGPSLQIATIAFETRGISQTRSLQRSADKLFSVMASNELLLPILLLLAQQSQTCAYRTDINEATLKGIGALFDDLRGIFYQYILFLSSTSLSQKPPSVAAREDFFAKMPSLESLVNEYGMEPMTVLFICRTALQRSIVEMALAATAEKKNKVLAPMKEETPAEVEARLKASITASKEVMPEDNSMDVDSKESAGPWLSILKPWIDAVKKVLPSRVDSILGAPFYVTFWQLTQFEIVSLVTHYKEQVTKVVKLAEQHARAEPGPSKSSRDRLAWSEKKERIDSFKESLLRESNEHLAVYTATKRRLAVERLHWFDGNFKESAELLKYIVQYCVIPRALLSPMDAEFSAQFIRILHGLGTKGFWTLGCYNRLFGEANGIIAFSCTQNEARNYGHFLRCVLQDLTTWHKDEAAYKGEGKKGSTILPGFTRLPMHPTSEDDMLSWKEFQRLVRNFHNKLSAALTSLIKRSDGEFMSVSNAILILKEILPVFPLREINRGTGAVLDEALQSLLATEKRGDIKILATSYQGQLRMAKRQWEEPTAPVVATTEASTTRMNGHAAPLGPKAPASGPPVAPAAARPPTVHPLPLNPERSRNATAAAAPDAKSVGGIERPQVIKRINRDEANPKDVTEQGTSDNMEKLAPSKVLAPDSVDSSVTNSPRPANSPAALGQKEVPLGPRNPGQRGHRISEDPSSRPPPSASMPPPKGPSSTLSAQEIRASVSERARVMGERDGAGQLDSKQQPQQLSSDSKRGEPSRSSEVGRSEARRRSPSPATRASGDGAGQDGNSGSRRRGGGGDDVHRSSSTRDEHRSRSDRRTGRSGEEDREREKERRSEKERDRESGSGRRERESSNRAAGGTSSSRNDELSPARRSDEGGGRKRTRDAREEEPQDRNAKRLARDRDEKKDRTERSTRSGRDGGHGSSSRTDKDHRHRDRTRREDGNSAGASPRDQEREGGGGMTTGAGAGVGAGSKTSSAPSGPRAMGLFSAEDKRALMNATESARRERERADTPPTSHRHSGSTLGGGGGLLPPPPPPPIGPSRGTSSGLRRDSARDERDRDRDRDRERDRDRPSVISSTLAEPGAGGTSLVSRIGNANAGTASGTTSNMGVGV